MEDLEDLEGLPGTPLTGYGGTHPALPAPPADRHSILQGEIFNLNKKLEKADQFFSMNSLKRKEVSQDGNSLFRSVCCYLNDDENDCDKLRKNLINYIDSYRQKFEVLIPKNFDEYLKEISQNDVHGTETEINILATQFNAIFKVFVFNEENYAMNMLKYEPLESVNTPKSEQFQLFKIGNYFQPVFLLKCTSCEQKVCGCSQSSSSRRSPPPSTPTSSKKP